MVLILILIITRLQHEHEQNANNEQNADNAGCLSEETVKLGSVLLTKERFSTTCDRTGQAVGFSVLHQNGNRQYNTKNQQENLKC